MNNRFTDLLARRRCLLADGATGSNLFEMGLISGDAPELWNVDHPDRIKLLHQRFVDAGADIILTNTFGGTRYRLKLHKAEERVRELNRTAAQLARSVADASGREIIVAGSMGPTGEILEPLGPVSSADASAAFAEQAVALAEGGADVLWIETLSSREELEAAIEGARAAGVPIVSTLSFDTNGRTMMSLTPAELAGIAREQQLAACGSNCGVGPAELIASILNLSTAADPDMVLVANANADADPDSNDKTAVRQAIGELFGLLCRARLPVAAAVDLERRHPFDSPRHRGRVMRCRPHRQIL